MYKSEFVCHLAVTIYSVHFNGNDPSRHARFLRSLRETGIQPFYTYELRDPRAERPRKKHLSLDVFADTLVEDADVCIDIHPDDGIEITAAVSRVPTQPDIVWSARYSQPYTRANFERLGGFVSDIYHHEFR